MAKWQNQLNVNTPCFTAIILADRTGIKRAILSTARTKQMEWKYWKVYKE